MGNWGVVTEIVDQVVDTSVSASFVDRGAEDIMLGSKVNEVSTVASFETFRVQLYNGRTNQKQG